LVFLTNSSRFGIMAHPLRMSSSCTVCFPTNADLVSLGFQLVPPSHSEYGYSLCFG
jgi:hypothetical protein